MLRVGTLAGGDASVNDDWSLTGSLACGFNQNFSVELWSGLANHEHEVSIAGLGAVASVKHRPTTLVAVETLGNVGTAEVDPLVYGISAGFRF